MTTKEPFFSVIIPTLNEEAYLPKLLNNLCKQSYKQFEVLIIDGQSQDKTLEKAQKFTNELSLSLYSHKAKGVSSQRNFGSKKAKGQYLVFFDADVSFPQNYFKTLFEQIKKEGGYLFTTKLDVNNDSQTQLMLIELTNFVINILNTMGKPFAPGFNIVVERKVFADLRGFDPKLKLAEDHDLVQRARKNGILLKVLKKPILYPSFRRPEKIGYLNFLTQYVIAGLYTLTTGPIKKELFSYPMGGHVYQEAKIKKSKIREIIKKIEFPF